MNLSATILPTGYDEGLEKIIFSRTEG